MSLDRFIDAFSAWIGLVARGIVSLLSRARSVHAARVIEDDDGTLHLEQADGARLPLVPGSPASPPGAPEAPAIAELKGRDVELVLSPAQVLFRPLELPARAGEFLGGIVRAQIDRLTPWTPEEAAFGWTPPRAAGDDRITLLVAATARARITPRLAVLQDLGATAISVSTPHPAGEDGRIAIGIAGQAAHGAQDIARIQRLLTGALLGLTLVASLCVGAAQMIGAHLGAERDDIEQRIATRRQAIAAQAAAGGSASPLRQLERRKHDSAADVLVIEVLSELLPDDTYLSELHIAGEKLQMMGVSQDAAGLIRLLEQSSRFAEATFAAPTTRLAQEPGERFHIAARIRTPFEVTR